MIRSYYYFFWSGVSLLSKTMSFARPARQAELFFTWHCICIVIGSLRKQTTTHGDEEKVKRTKDFLRFVCDVLTLSPIDPEGKLEEGWRKMGRNPAEKKRERVSCGVAILGSSVTSKGMVDARESSGVQSRWRRRRCNVLIGTGTA